MSRYVHLVHLSTLDGLPMLPAVLRSEKAGLAAQVNPEHSKSQNVEAQRSRDQMLRNLRTNDTQGISMVFGRCPPS